MASTMRVAQEAVRDTEGETIAAAIREQAVELLQDKRVGVVLGYTSGWSADASAPVMVTSVFGVPRLVFNAACTHNLAKYLVGYEGLLTSRFKTKEQRLQVAIVARPATMRAIVGLIQEHQINREDVVVLGITDGTPVGIEPDIVVGTIQDDAGKRQAVDAKIAALQQLAGAERWAWWDQEFSKCIRCYACRQVCPFCYCEQCIADQNQPQWIEKSSSPWNNRVWNMVRAFHLVGRCVECGECERVCPVDIPLSVLNGELARKAQETFGYTAGLDTQAPPVLFCFERDDPGSFIR